MGSKVQSFTPQGKAPPEFNELKGQSSLGISKLSARKEAKLHAFLRANGGLCSQAYTQDLGNCLYAAVLRGYRLQKGIYNNAPQENAGLDGFPISFILQQILE